MHMIELIENRKFKVIQKRVKAEKLEDFFFCFLRYNNLYKGKNRYVLEIWKSITNENKQYYRYKDFTFVNFKYVCNNLTCISKKKKKDSQYEVVTPSKVCEKWNADTKDIVHVFLLQLFHIVLYNAEISKRGYEGIAVDVDINSSEVKVEDPHGTQSANLNESVIGKKGSQNIENRENYENKQNNENYQNRENSECSSLTSEAFSTFSRLTIINENREFEILFNIIHPYIYSTYVSNMVAHIVDSPSVNISECFLQYILYTLYNIYLQNKNVLFFYFVIYKNLKKIRNNIINTIDILIEWKIAKFIKKKYTTVITNFKCLRRFLLNISDRNTIENFVYFILTYLHNQLITICPNNLDIEFISYRKENNLFEFSFFIYLSMQDLCEKKNRSFFSNYNTQKIKSILKNEQVGIFDIYIVLYYITNCNCDNYVKLKFILLTLIKSALSPDLFMQHGEIFFSKWGEAVKKKMRISKGDLSSGHTEDANLDGANVGVTNIGGANTRRGRVVNENSGTNEEEHLPTQGEISVHVSNLLTSNDTLIEEFIKKETFYNLAYIFKHIYACCYTIINNKREYCVKFDSYEHVDVENTTYNYNYCYYSDVIMNDCNFSIAPTTDETINKNYVTVVALLIHMNIISINDIWSCHLLRLVEHSNFFQILNFLKIKKKNVLFYLTISSFLKINYQSMFKFTKLQKDISAEKECCPADFLYYVHFYKYKMKQEYFSKINLLRKNLMEYNFNENKIVHLMCLHLMDIKKYIIMLPLNVLKSVFKNIFKYLSSPIHDVKKSISEYFRNMCLRIAFYTFELIFIISSYIYYSGQVQNKQEYNKKFYIFSFFFNLIDVYIKFVEKYNKKNNTFVFSFLNYQFVQAFFLFFDYTYYVTVLSTQLNDSAGKEAQIGEGYCHCFYHSRCFECEKRVKCTNDITLLSHEKKKRKDQIFFLKKFTDIRFMQNESHSELPANSLTLIEDLNYHMYSYNKIMETHRNNKNAKEKKISDLFRKYGTFNEYYSNNIISIILKFINNNKVEINCYFYTLLLYAVAKLHLSQSYRYREINYLTFLHLLPWKNCLDFCIKNSQLSCFFFQKFYECVHNLLPEIVIEHFHDDIHFTHISGKTENLMRYFIKERKEGENFQGGIYPYDRKNNFNGECNSKGKEGSIGGHSNSYIILEMEQQHDSELDFSNFECTNLYEQIIRGKEVTKVLFFSENYKYTNVYYLNKIFKSNLLKNCILITTFVNVYFLKRQEQQMSKNNFIDIIQSLFDEHVTSYYISIFQNPLNFFLKCSTKFCKLLVEYDYMDNVIFFIFTKLYNYLSLMPPKISMDDFLPINVEDITSLQETAIAQFVLNLREGNIKEQGEKEKEEVLRNDKTYNAYNTYKPYIPYNTEQCEGVTDMTVEGNKNSNSNSNCSEMGKKGNKIFDDVAFFLKKMHILVRTFNPNCLNSLCESGFNVKSAFYLSFYLTPTIFTNIFFYLNNNIMAIVNENFNVEDNLKYYEHIHVNKRTDEHALDPYNIIDKTLFYLQIVVFYLIVNANNKLMDISNYTQNVCTYFTNCLQIHIKPHIDKFIISVLPIMLQYFYFFPLFIPSALSYLTQIPNYDNEFSEEIAKFEKKIRRILEVSYKFGSERKASS
ncbi:conserved Plasmodium protein, unknown function [Plasmodium malariae]|uniref:Uncharacterized protein n=1 Tax=Plasmodium malariae TaxID=5858 RepID=A0A1C3L330_PLAMA|nr:conserved Plasmodium protein, unknown function [Plasmodium malariae]